MAGRSSLVSASRARRKRRLRIIRGVFIVVVVAGLAFGMYWGLTDDALQVSGYRIIFADNKIDTAVESALEARVEELLAQPIAYIVPRTHVAAFWPSMYESSFTESDPRIEKVDIERTFHDATITVTLRGPYATWCDSGRTWCVAIDATGRVVDMNALDETHVTLTTMRTAQPNLGTMALEPEQFVTLYTVLEAIERTAGRPDTVFIDQDNVAIVRVPDMTQFKILLDQSAELTNKYLSFFAERIKTEGMTFGDYVYVDLRFGNAVYYLTKHATQSAAVAKTQGQ